MKHFRQINFPLIILSMFGIGKSPISPGTLGSIFSVPIIFLFYITNQPILFIILLLLTYFLSERFIFHYVKKPYDRQWIVIDEYLGMGITLLPLFILHSFSIWHSIIGLLLFRLFDIRKPFYIQSIDNLETASSVLLDDILAGIYSGVILYLLLIYLHW